MNSYKEFSGKISSYYDNPQTRFEITNYILSIKSFNSFNDWKNVIKVCFEVGDFIERYPKEILEKIEIAQDVFVKEEVDGFLIDYLKNESDLTKNFSNFFYPLMPHFDDSDKDKIWNHEIIRDICITRFRKYCKDGSDIEIAFNLFYSCWKEVDSSNTVHILPQALSYMRIFIDKVPEDYLKFLIRPKYVPLTAKLENCYSFVFEPFTDKIFESWANFYDFLDSLETKGVDFLDLIQKIKLAFNIFKSSGFRTIPVNNRKEARQLGIKEEFILQIPDLDHN